MTENWKTMSQFLIYKQLCNEIGETEKNLSRFGEYKSEFMKESQFYLNKHVNQWESGYLLPMILAGEKQIATSFANWLIHGNNYIDELDNTSFFSKYTTVKSI